MEKNRKMPDQAQKLRELVEEAKLNDPILREELGTFSYTIAFISARSGMGKTNLVANLGVSISGYKKKVLLFDVDNRTSDLVAIFGLSPKYDFNHFLKNNKNISDIIIQGAQDVDIVSGAQKILDLKDFKLSERKRFIEQMSSLEKNYNFILFDMPTGVEENYINFLTACDEVVIVSTPEPTTVMDTYSMVKIISSKDLFNDMKLIINMAKDEKVAETASEKIISVAKKFLGIEIDNLGYVLFDRNLERANNFQKPFVLTYPYSPASRGFKDLAAIISNYFDKYSSERKTNKSFFKRINDFN